MISIYINDEPMHIEPMCSVQELLVKTHYDAAHIAVAVNQQFIPRQLCQSTLLKDGDRVDLIAPMQGG